MPAPLESDVPNIDARHSQNLTINITYLTAPTYNAPTPQIRVSQTSVPDSFEGRRPVPDCKSACMPEFCLLIIVTVVAQPFQDSLPRKKLLLRMLWHLQLPKP
ncbi:hypothetical protein PILCRDRAFT_830132 [Piloderma croceum F 1598]|uniref:Uncharacterized protein n=1 Tax=Piloderma croceum (strain F 1598) TaxID=765440 RepID=A0A0C3EVE1_PILCF|nr:hypothetical protein PILCRDRAFT_830132 [Piloderma croceum F 1598]